MKRLRRVGMGIAVEIPSPKVWSNIPAGIDMHQVWKIVGPQVEMHIDRLPLWRVFCAVYVEGLAHGMLNGPDVHDTAPR